MGRLCVSATAGVVAVTLSGCTPPPEGLSFAVPSPATAGTVQSAKTPAEIATTLAAAGFADVRVDSTGRMIALRSDTGNMIDCGAITQFAFGNRATFAGAAPRAAIVVDEELYVRNVAVSSTAQVSQVSTGTYAISENHSVTVTYNSPAGSQISRETKTFDEAGRARFSDGIVCVSAGAVAAAL